MREQSRRRRRRRRKCCTTRGDNQVAKGNLVQDVENNKPRLNEAGHETLDTTPVAIPIKLQRADNIASEVARLVRGTLSQLAEAQGHETFEESDDFDVGEDFDPKSPYEIDDEDLYYDYRMDPRYRPAEPGDSESRTRAGTPDAERPAISDQQEAPGRAPDPQPAPAPSPRKSGGKRS